MIDIMIISNNIGTTMATTMLLEAFCVLLSADAPGFSVAAVVEAAVSVVGIFVVVAVILIEVDFVVVLGVVVVDGVDVVEVADVVVDIVVVGGDVAGGETGLVTLSVVVEGVAV